MKGKKQKQKHAESDFVIITRFMKGQYHLFVLALFCSVMVTVLNALTPQIISITIDAVLSTDDYTLPKLLQPFLTVDWLREAPVRSLILAAGSIAVIAVLSGVSSAFMRTLVPTASEGFIKALRDELFEHIQHLPFAWHTENKTGDIIQRCTSDVEVIRNFVTNQLTEVIRIFFLIVYTLGIMFSMNVKITLIAAVFIPIVVGYSYFFLSKIADRFQKADEAEGALSTDVQENLTGVRVVRAFGRERLEVEQFEKKNALFTNRWISLGKFMNAYWAVGDVITGLQALSVCAVGAAMAAHGEITLGTFTAFVSYNATLSWPIRSLGRILSEMSKASVSIRRVRFILDAEEEKKPETPVCPDLHQDIRFENVSFSYTSDAASADSDREAEASSDEVLHSVSFTIPKGSTFAILGSTGSGKSTMMQLIDRLYDVPEGKGRITIGGVDVKDIDQTYLRRQIGLVLQEPYLFSRTIRENIGIAAGNTSMEEIRDACHIACVDEAINTFAEGYDTIVGERGVTLSGGQKQRVAIARMLMGHTPVMIFDDSLSAVDAETDVMIRRRLRERMQDATVILISHRITTLMQADQILVMRDGRIEDIGTHQELIEREGMYRDIYEIQMNQDDRRLLEEEVQDAD